MSWTENFNAALHTLKGNRLRASLTLLSVAIGVFSIISVMTSIGALQNSIESGLSMLGANTFQIQKYPNDMGGGPGRRERFRNRMDITWKQGIELVKRAEKPLRIGLESWHFGATVGWRNKRTDPNIPVAGETPEGLLTNQWEIEYGRSLTQSDIDLARPVVVIGPGILDRLFPTAVNPVGETVRMKGRDFTIVGVMRDRGGLFGRRDNYFIIPISTFFHMYGSNRSLHIMVQAPSRESFDAVQDEVIGILRSLRNVPPGEENDFAIFSNESVITQFNEMTFALRAGTLAVAAVALLAAGIGIMNIMLVSVTERTREIGVRKAVGATRRAIVSQFLNEAVSITLLGGLAGIIAGLLAGNALAMALEIDGIVQPLWIAVGLAACGLIGIAFGTYPAWKAANLDPIEALRYE